MQQVEPAGQYERQEPVPPSADPGDSEIANLREENRQLRELVIRLSNIAIRNAIERK
ncbi:MAG TPA: hypothetical protein VHA77_14485 [Xanthobacteraceae bacterium]|jgi:hypothetical protein|nr:hypothetical protein [Xanthobacteraceae bacterium]